MNTFQTFGLPSNIGKALERLNFQVPTPIQSKAIPIAMTGKDLIGVAQTGTGKTAAFCIPSLIRLSQSKDKIGLVLAPTRELVQQIDLFWRNITQFTPDMRSALLIGGAAMFPQIAALRKRPRMIIATPGRLVDHIRRGNVNLSNVDILILDEADRMLDMGFAPQLNDILRKVPRERQTMMFTATWEQQLDQLSRKYLNNPERVTVGQVSQAATKIDQSIIETTVKMKNDTLLDTLNDRDGSILVFARTKSRTDRVAKYLASYGVSVGRIHGDRSQAQRNTALESFRKGSIRVLVATDVASRGIDVSNIAHVINYDLPMAAEDYIHRIGRTGRAGKSGSAISFVTPEERRQWNDITRLLKKTGSQLPRLQTH